MLLPLFYRFLYICSLVGVCVTWQLALPVPWAIFTIVYLAFSQVVRMYSEGPYWDMLSPNDDKIVSMLDTYRNWRIGLGVLTCGMIVASGVVAVLQSLSDTLDVLLIITSCTFILASVPAAFALMEHYTFFPDARKLRYRLAVSTSFNVIYGVFALLLSMYSSSLDDADDLTWRAIASYLVWVAILHLIYEEYREFSFLRFVSFITLYVVLCVRLHDTSDSLIEMRFI